MTEEGVDQVAVVKASLEMMITENEEIHEYFSDLVEKLAQLDAMPVEERRGKFDNLVEMGAFNFNGIEIRRLTRTQTQKPLPPPMFLTRTKRRLKNTVLMVEEFKNREIFPEADVLLEEIDMLSSTIVNENDHKEVMAFKKNVESLRELEVFQTYVKSRDGFIHKDAGLKSDVEFIAAKETVEEGEELLRQRSEELSELSEKVDKGEVSSVQAENILDKMSLDKT